MVQFRQKQCRYCSFFFPMDRVSCPNCGRGYKIYNRKKRCVKDGNVKAGPGH